MAHQVPEPTNHTFNRKEFAVLWTIVVLTYGIGDLLTTYYVLWTTPSIVELNVLILAMVARYGTIGLIALKLGGLLLCLCIAVYANQVKDRFLYYWPPVLLIGLGTFVTVYNTTLLLG